MFHIKHFTINYSRLCSHLPTDNTANESYRPFSQRMFSFRNSRLFDKHKLRESRIFGRVSEPMWLKRYQYWKSCEVAIAVAQATRCRNLHEESGQTPISRKVNSIGPPMVLVGIILPSSLSVFLDKLIDSDNCVTAAGTRNRRRC